MQFHDFIERRLVKGPAHQPAFLAKTPKIGLPEILDPDQTLFGVVKINPGRANLVLGEKLRDSDVVPVLFPLEAILHQDDRLLRRTADPVKFPIGAALLDRRDFDARFVQPGEMQARLAEQTGGPGGFRGRRHYGGLLPFDGSGQYNYEGESAKRFLRPAKELCFPGSPPPRRGNQRLPHRTRKGERWGPPPRPPRSPPATPAD